MDTGWDTLFIRLESAAAAIESAAASEDVEAVASLYGEARPLLRALWSRLAAEKAAGATPSDQVVRRAGEAAIRWQAILDSLVGRRDILGGRLEAKRKTARNVSRIGGTYVSARQKAGRHLRYKAR